MRESEATTGKARLHAFTLDTQVSIKRGASRCSGCSGVYIECLAIAATAGRCVDPDGKLPEVWAGLGFN